MGVGDAQDHLRGLVGGIQEIPHGRLRTVTCLGLGESSEGLMGFMLE